MHVHVLYNVMYKCMYMYSVYIHVHVQTLLGMYCVHVHVYVPCIIHRPHSLTYIYRDQCPHNVDVHVHYDNMYIMHMFFV